MLLYFRFFSIVMLVVWAAVIFIFSAQTATESAGLSHDFTHTVLCAIWQKYGDMSPAQQEEIRSHIGKYVRKTAHFTIYTILGFILGTAAHSFLLKPRLRWLVPAAFGLLYAASDEIHQIFVQGRSGEIGDICIDFIGVLLGILLSFSAAKAFRAMRHR